MAGFLLVRHAISFWDLDFDYGSWNVGKDRWTYCIKSMWPCCQLPHRKDPLPWQRNALLHWNPELFYVLIHNLESCNESYFGMEDPWGLLGGRVELAGHWTCRFNKHWTLDVGVVLYAMIYILHRICQWDFAFPGILILIVKKICKYIFLA